MAAVWADDFLIDLWDLVRANMGLKLHLAQNNPNGGVWDNTLTLASFTESTFTGYAAVAVTLPSGPTLAAHIASMAASLISFTITGGANQNVYGWYITDTAGTRLRCHCKDDAAPVIMSTTGVNVYTVSTIFKDKDVATP